MLRFLESAAFPERNPSPMIRVLVVEDDPDLRDDIVFGLRHEGFETSGAPDGGDLERRLADSPADVLVLDVMLPGDDGLTIARRLGQSHPHLGIVMLTGRAGVADRILGLESGADIYLAKTTERRELVAAIRAVARRVAMLPEADAVWRLDAIRMKLLTPDGAEISLTRQEFLLMQVFARAYGGEASRRKLIEGLGQNFLDFDERRLETLISRLRRKLAPYTGSKRIIRALRAEGYLFAGPLRER